MQPVAPQQQLEIGDEALGDDIHFIEFELKHADPSRADGATGAAQDVRFEALDIDLEEIDTLQPVSRHDLIYRGDLDRDLLGTVAMDGFDDALDQAAVPAALGIGVIEHDAGAGSGAQSHIGRPEICALDGLRQLRERMGIGFETVESRGRKLRQDQRRILADIGADIKDDRVRRQSRAQAPEKAALVELRQIVIVDAHAAKRDTQE
jgi:hypothetical protein